MANPLFYRLRNKLQNFLSTISMKRQSFESKTSKQYACDYCNYSTDRKSSYEKHIDSVKHKSNVTVDASKTLICGSCCKEFLSRSGLWRHSQTCETLQSIPLCEPIANAVESENTALTTAITTEAFMAVFSQNTTLTNYLIEQNRMLTEQNKDKQSSVNYSHNNITTNSHNTNSQTFNLQFFLNETCKNAMNLTDFIDQIEITMEDLENMRLLGYSDGVSNIIIKNLNKVALSDRPLHSNDVKRELFYIRNNNKWIKETENYQHILNAVKTVVKKNTKQLMKWRELNPEFKDSSTKTCDIHHQMIINMYNGSDEEEQKNNSKIIRTIAAKVPIPKV